MDRARILRQMGVDVWRLRPEIEAPRRRVEAVAEAAAAAGRTSDRGLRQRTVSTSVAERPGAAFEVLCLAIPGVVLLTDAADQRSARRLALDVLAALRDDRAVRPQEIVFGWPQPGVDAVEAHARKALAAFVEKQLGDSKPRTTVVCETVRARVPDGCLPDDVLVIPDLVRLAADGTLKRALWRELRARL